MAEPLLSIIIATRNRAQSLARTLRTLEVALDNVAGGVEVLIVDNGSSDATPSVLAQWRPIGAVETKVLRTEQPGKARALNAAWPQARAHTLAFTDDDVEVPPLWLRIAAEFSAGMLQYAAATGPVRLPPEQRRREIMELVNFYRTIPLFDRGPQLQPSKHLYGCNMLVRKSALAAVGGFDARLGPGASGLHEDGDLAHRLRQAGYALAYLPQLEMFHIVEPERLCWEYFCRLHRADAQSRFVRDGNLGLGYALRHWFGAAAVWALWSLLGNRNRRMRARGRLLSHTEYLRLCWLARTSPPSGGSTSNGHACAS
ncbi:MAG: glycosyltransferase [Candidatus Binatia bacterium]|nr:glycosyltransferase [Candidatus Binatia bacterium]